MIKYIIACIDNDLEMLDDLYNKISRIVDSDYIIESYINAEQALIGCFNNIIAGNEILITINGKNNAINGNSEGSFLSRVSANLDCGVTAVAA
jgi:hypothetical protein